MENAPFPPGVHKVISRFYDLVDPLDPDTDCKLATEVFAPDGTFIVNSGELKGPEQIQNWSKGAEKVLALRRHDISGAYACGGNVFMTSGVVTLKMKNGKEASSPYCARCVVDDAEARNPRIKIWQGWFDNTPFLSIGLHGPVIDSLRKAWSEAGI